MVTVSKISDRVFILTDGFGCGADLVIGSKGALLYDTGCGAEDMSEAVRSITNLPLTVIASHGHFDHIGGSRFFDKVYMSLKDRCILEESMGRLPCVFFLSHKGSHTVFSSLNCEKISNISAVFLPGEAH